MFLATSAVYVCQRRAERGAATRSVVKFTPINGHCDGDFITDLCVLEIGSAEENNLLLCIVAGYSRGHVRFFDFDGKVSPVCVDCLV
jgi:hypothetical protein